MNPLRWLLLALATLPITGCASVLHELQIHRMNRLNRGPAPSEDPEFSRTEPAGTGATFPRRLPC